MSYLGVYDRTIFYNPASKYCIISVKTSDQSIPQQARSAYKHRDHLIRFVAVGYELPRTDKVSMRLDGEWQNSKHGYQLQVDQCEEIVPQTKDGVQGYLSSRLIKGVGEKTAELIVGRFGADALKVLENEPERLLEIRGITPAKLEDIKTSYAESRCLRDLMLLLSPFQVTPAAATKIYEHFGAKRDVYKRQAQAFAHGKKRCRTLQAEIRRNFPKLSIPRVLRVHKRHVVRLIAVLRHRLMVCDQSIIRHAAIGSCIAVPDIGIEVCMHKAVAHFNMANLFAHFHNNTGPFVAQNGGVLSKSGFFGHRAVYNMQIRPIAKSAVLYLYQRLIVSADRLWDIITDAYLPRCGNNNAFHGFHATQLLSARPLKSR